jgi:hypothetical protein
MAEKCINVEVKIKDGTAVTMNGESPIGLMMASNTENKVHISFVSKKLKRALHSGAVIDIGEMDSFCRAWIKAREGTSSVSPEEIAIAALNKAESEIRLAKESIRK